MDFLLVLLVLAVLAIPVLLIIFMVWTSRLARDVRALKMDMQRLQAGQAPSGVSAGPAPEPKPKREEPPEPVEEKPAPPPAAAKTAPGPWKVSAPDEPPSEGGPEAEAPPPTPSPAPAGPPRAVVFTAERFDALMAWLKANWIYVVSAVSLALAGLFLVEYGIEIGLLTPAVRVLAGLLLGTGFVVGGEYIRRRWGDRPEAATAFLPSVFSGAGLVVLFGSVLAALHLYQLFSPTLALIGLVAVSALGTGLGWYTGPLLAALGILGAFAAPFVVGGESDAPEMFYGYFGLVAVVGLAIDAGRRWAWVSVLALALVFPAATRLYIGIGRPEYYAALVAAMVAASMAIPPLRLWPAHGGAALIQSFSTIAPRRFPEFPTRLVAGALLAAVAALVFVAVEDPQGMWIAAIGLAALFLGLSVWAYRAEALEDLAVLPAVALVALPVIEKLVYGAQYRAFVDVLTAEEGTPIPTDLYWLVALAGLLTLAAAWRSWTGARWPVAWAAGAALMTPAMGGALEIFWVPTRVIGAYNWALTAIFAAGLMTALALVFAPRDGERRPRVSAFALAAIALIAFALTLVLSETALTLALAVTTLAAAALDRRFGLRPISVAVQAGAVILAARLVLYPGLDWAWRASYPDFIAAFAGSVAALAAVIWIYRTMTRPMTRIVVESAAWSLGAIFASLLLARIIEDAAPGDQQISHWAFGLQALVWIAAAAAQLWRVQAGGPLATLRRVLAAVYGIIAVLVLAFAATILNPAVDASGDNAVLGPPLFNTLLVAYALPAAVTAWLTRRFAMLPRELRWGLTAVAAALAALWLYLAIRHFWRGADIDAGGFTDPELYTYTMALLVIGAGLLWQAIAKRSDVLRKLGMGVIALTIAKVFLVDMSGLVGLLRVFSFLALGLALAGLAFLNRWAASHIDDGEAEEEAQ